ncbi:MAG: DHH family phosphoesterase [Spiroplasma sp.]
MDNFKKNAKKIYDLIKKSNPIIIHRHISPDGDALGSQWGLKTIIEENFPNKKVLVPGDMTDYMLQFFQTSDIVNSKDYHNALVIICDTANKERISGQFWQEAKNIVKIDHHPKVDNYATIDLVDSSASAACQVAAKWAKTLKLKVSQTAARYLFFGLVTDSGRFLYRSVSSETFAMASFLVAKNFNLLDLYEKLYLQELKTAWIKGYILSNFEVTKHGLGYLIFNKKDLLKLEAEMNDKIKNFNKKEKVTLIKEDFTNQVNLMSNIKGIKIWFIACQDNFSSDFKVSIRSARWQVNKVVAKFGGGGHDSAAGVRLESQAVVCDLFNALDKLANLSPNIK